MDLFRGYVDNVALQSADKLIADTNDDGGVMVIEYEVHGTIVATVVWRDRRLMARSAQQ